jgi:hypothetical protein
LIAGALLPGCGGTDKRPITGSGSSASRRPVVATGRSRHETRADIVAAVASCRRGVNTGSWLPSASKTQLYAICENGLHRGLTEIRQYSLEVCNEVVFTSPAKDEAERARVLAACYTETKQKTAKIE